MIAILCSKPDTNSILLEKALKDRNVESILVFPEDIETLLFTNKKLPELKLKNGRLIDSVNDFIVNRIPELHYNHPLIAFLYNIPYDRVITHPSSGVSLSSKISQLTYFDKIPPTEVIKGFRPKLTSRTCTKSLSQTRSMVRPSNDKGFIHDAVLDMPVMFQNIIEGDHTKTILLADDMFTYKFDANSLDPREQGFKTTRIKTPKELTECKKSLVEYMGTNYFDIDLIHNESGCYFLELNSSPGPCELAHLSGDDEIIDRYIKFLLNEEYTILVGAKL